MRMAAWFVMLSLLLLCIQLTLTVIAFGSQANENIWTERLEEHLHVVRCKAPYDVVSLTVFTGSGTALASYHATPSGQVCKSTSTFSSCVYNKSIAMVSVIVMGLEEGETTVFRCDIYTFSSKGGQNEESYFVNVTQERKASPSISTGTTLSQMTTLQFIQPSNSNSLSSSNYYADIQFISNRVNALLFFTIVTFIITAYLLYKFICYSRRGGKNARKEGNSKDVLQSKGLTEDRKSVERPLLQQSCTPSLAFDCETEKIVNELMDTSQYAQDDL